MMKKVRIAILNDYYLISGFFGLIQYLVDFYNWFSWLHCIPNDWCRRCRNPKVQVIIMPSFVKGGLIPCFIKFGR